MQRFLAYTGLPGAFVGCGLLLALLTRMALVLVAWPNLDGGGPELLQVFLVGLVYDLIVAMCWLAALLWVRTLLPAVVLHSRGYRLLGWAVFLAGICLLQFVAVAEWFFWDEFQARFNFIAVDYLVYRREVTDNILQSYPVYPVLAAIGVLALGVTATIMWRVQPYMHRAAQWRSRLVVSLLCTGMAAGSLAWVGDSPQRTFHNAYAGELAADGTYQFFSAFRNNELDYDAFYQTLDDAVASAWLKQALDSHAPGLYRIDRGIAPPGDEKQLNVVLVVIESLSAKYLGVYGNREGLTPTLDALARESLVFDNFYAAGTRTVRGLEAITLSIPPTPGQSIVRRPDNGGLFNIGTPFLDRGYEVRFFYGGHGYFDNMNAFFGSSGFHVLDRTDIPDEAVTFSNAWGVADEDLYRQVLQRASADWQGGQPFFSLVMTTSNHRPYTYPAGRIDIPSGDGRRGAVKYTDYAIGNFLAEARRQPWFDSTVFIFVADHCAGVAGKTVLPVKDYHIPLFVYSPAHVPAGHVTALAGQMDIAPTLLGLLNFHYQSRYFGRDVLHDHERPELALIANYQAIGVLEPEILTVLEPQRRIRQFEDPLGIQRELPDIRDAEEVTEAIALYQGASQIWSRRLTRVVQAPLPLAVLHAQGHRL